MSNMNVSPEPDFLLPQISFKQPIDSTKLFWIINIIVIILLIGVGVAISVGMYSAREDELQLSLYEKMVNVWIGGWGIVGVIAIVLIVSAFAVFQPIYTIRQLWTHTRISLASRIGELENRLGVFIVWVEKFATGIAKKADARSTVEFVKQMASTFATSPS